ncbi:MAG: hypothetical protein AB7T58_04700, partial [Hyphomonadaceae bacterium]
MSLTFTLPMRFHFLALALGMTTTAAATEPLNARAAFVERRALLEADAQCRLFTPDIRSALTVGVAQARGALLRAGWTSANMRSLESAAVSAARSRACNDQRTAVAADDARRAFSSWINVSAMEFPGWERSWRARRTSGEGWRLSQTIDAATFGVRQRDEVQHLTLVVPVSPRAAPPATAQLIMRNVARAGVREIPLTQRVSEGLAAGLPAPNGSVALPSARTLERI